MRIFYACDHEPFPGNNLWHNNLFLPLMDLGHDVIPFDFNLLPYQNVDPYLPTSRAFLETERPRLEKALLQQIGAAHREKRIDLFFSYFHSAFCRPEVIREIRSMGIRTVNWFCNGSYQFYLVEQLAPAYDFCLVPEKFRLADYRKVGAMPIYCQEAANPNVYKPYPVPQEFDVTFVGQGYGDRIAHICHLLENRIDVRVWGPRWEEWGAKYRPKTIDLRPQTQSERLQTSVSNSLQSMVYGLRSKVCALKRLRRRALRLPTYVPTKRLHEIAGPPLSDEEMVKMYSRSKINLGFSSCGDTHLNEERILQVRLRDFEVPMSGGFYMVEYMEELKEFFVIGKEVVCYQGQGDLLDKIQYYLKHDREREQIRAAGRERCLRDHTWQKRLSDSFRAMGETNT